MRNIIIISGSPKENGNTACLIDWLKESIDPDNCACEVVHVASPSFNAKGCRSCRVCQKKTEYECTIDDDAKPVLKKIAESDIIVMATPLYFFGPSAQLKIIIDRMFSLYKWDNDEGTMQTPLKGKTLVLLGSAYEDIGLEALEKPFQLTADYTAMSFKSLVIPNAGISGDIQHKKDVRGQILQFANEL